MRELRAVHDQLVSAGTAASLLDIGVSTFRERAKAEGLNRYRIGSAVRYDKREVLTLAKPEPSAPDIEAKAERILRRAK
ncbi:MAG TPA: hypothetical protein VMY76_00820 [Gemmatimonadales bacterium]|nr:hypothetical protein [Gemmatimonadales bacterium]